MESHEGVLIKRVLSFFYSYVSKLTYMSVRYNVVPRETKVLSSSQLKSLVHFDFDKVSTIEISSVHYLFNPVVFTTRSFHSTYKLSNASQNNDYGRTILFLAPKRKAF